MEIEIISKKENPLLEREEYKLEVSTKTTPKFEEIKKEVANKIGADIESTIIRKIETQYGTPNIIVLANVYKNKDIIKKVELKKVLIKNGLIKKEEKK